MDKKESFWSKVKVNGLIGKVKRESKLTPNNSLAEKNLHVPSQLLTKICSKLCDLLPQVYLVVAMRRFTFNVDGT
jgi:hypothetical protein